MHDCARDTQNEIESLLSEVARDERASIEAKRRMLRCCAIEEYIFAPAAVLLLILSMVTLLTPQSLTPARSVDNHPVAAIELSGPPAKKSDRLSAEPAPLPTITLLQARLLKGALDGSEFDTAPPSAAEAEIKPDKIKKRIAARRPKPAVVSRDETTETPEQPWFLQMLFAKIMARG